MKTYFAFLFLLSNFHLSLSQTTSFSDTSSRLSKFYFRGHGFWMNINGNDRSHRIIIYNDYFNVGKQLRDSTMMTLSPSVTSDSIYESNLKLIGDSLEQFTLRQGLYRNLLDYERVFRKAKSINRTDRIFSPYRRMLNDAFSSYEPNYFIFSMPGQKFESDDEGDVKFQVSFKYNFLRRTIRDKIFFAVTFKALWDLYHWDDSAPMKDFNFMPQIWYEWDLKHELDKERSAINCMSLKVGISHESNGQPDTVFGRQNLNDRGWNKLFVAGNFRYNLQSYNKWTRFHHLKRIECYPRIWLPWGFTEQNTDIVHYLGYGRIVTNLVFSRANLNENEAGSYEFEIHVAPRTVNGTLSQLLLGLKIGPWNANTMYRSLPYFYIQYFSGYGESLLTYNRFSKILRAGIQLRIN
jgi:outer membrane phospholipase A